MLNRRLFQDQMGVCPYEPKRTYTRNTPIRTYWPGRGFGNHLHFHLIPWNVRIRCLKMQALRDPFMLERQYYFDNSGYACCRLGVPYIRLDGANQQWLVRSSAL